MMIQKEIKEEVSKYPYIYMESLVEGLFGKAFRNSETLEELGQSIKGFKNQLNIELDKQILKSEKDIKNKFGGLLK